MDSSFFHYQKENHYHTMETESKDITGMKKMTDDSKTMTIVETPFIYEELNDRVKGGPKTFF